MKIYPAIDLAGGKCVRLEQGRFDRCTVYGDDPLAMAATFAAQGATALHVVDLDGARDPALRQTELIARLVRAVSIPVQTGGGIRSIADVEGLLEAGVARVIIGSLTVREPRLSIEILERFDPTKIIFALDVHLDERGVFKVAQGAWAQGSKLTLDDALARYLPHGLKTVLCTDISRDGMLVGPSYELYRTMRARYPKLELLASGGVGTLDDLRALAAMGADGAIVGKALYAGRFTLQEALAC